VSLNAHLIPDPRRGGWRVDVADNPTWGRLCETREDAEHWVAEIATNCGEEVDLVVQDAYWRVIGRSTVGAVN
jgi:hypothetical protein